MLKNADGNAHQQSMGESSNVDWLMVNSTNGGKDLLPYCGEVIFNKNMVRLGKHFRRGIEPVRAVSADQI